MYGFAVITEAESSLLILSKTAVNLKSMSQSSQCLEAVDEHRGWRENGKTL